MIVLPFSPSDHPETVTSKRSVKFSCDIEPAQEIQPAQGGQEDEEEGEEEAREEEEDEEEDEGDKSEVATRETSRGNNWELERVQRHENEGGVK